MNMLLAIETGINKTASTAGLATGSVDIAERVGQIIGIALSLVGVVFLVLMVYGGYVWMTARGDDTKIKTAKETITSAVIGLIIVLAAYAITNFVLLRVMEATGN